MAAVTELEAAERTHAALLQTALAMQVELTQLARRLDAAERQQSVRVHDVPAVGCNPNPVLGKLAALLECAHRPLKDGEQPKRRGQSTVFEATGRLNPDICGADGALNKSIRSARVTIKHDGTCCYVTADGEYCKRLDIRRPATPKKAHKGKSKPQKPQQLPPNAIVLAEASSSIGGAGGNPDVCWIPVASSGNESKWHASAITGAKDALTAYTLRITGGGGGSGGDGFQIVEEELECGVSYELLGPKVQGNPYCLPQHCLVAHGSVAAAGWDMMAFEANPLQYATRRVTMDYGHVCGRGCGCVCVWAWAWLWVLCALLRR